MAVVSEELIKPALFPINLRTYLPYNQLKMSLHNLNHVNFKPFPNGPIIIEKLNSNSSNELDISFKPKTISKHRLDAACKLAKQDIQNQMLLQSFPFYFESNEKRELFLEKNNSKDCLSTKNSEQNKNSSKKFMENLVKKAEKPIVNEIVKLHKHHKNVLIQKDFNTSNGVSHKTFLSYYSEVEELKKVRKYISKNVDKIDTSIKLAILQNQLQPDENDDDIESKQKLLTAMEQCTRSARILYALEQQIKKIKMQIIHYNSGKLKIQNQKTILFRLTSIHRSALHIVEAFIKFIPDLGIHHILLFVYCKLANFLYQLNLCCIQLNVERDATFPNLKLYPLLTRLHKENTKKKIKPEWESSTKVSVLSNSYPVKIDIFKKDKHYTTDDLSSLTETLNLNKQNTRTVVMKPSLKFTKKKSKGVLIPNKFKYGKSQRSNCSICSSYSMPTFSSYQKSISRKNSVPEKDSNELNKNKPAFVSKTTIPSASKLPYDKKVSFKSAQSKQNRYVYSISDGTKPSTRQISYQTILHNESAPLQLEEEANSSLTTTKLEEIYRLEDVKKQRQNLSEKLQQLSDQTKSFKKQNAALIERCRTDSPSNSTPLYILSKSSLDLKNLIQRIQEMEDTQNEIRRRWSKITYTPNFRRVPTPEAYSKIDSPSSIVFTKNKMESKDVAKKCKVKFHHFFSGVQQSEKVSPEARLPTKVDIKLSDSSGAEKVSLSIPYEQRRDIDLYKLQYEQHLKQISHLASEDFDPWSLVQTVTDRILDDVIEEVAKELSDACSDVIEQLYKSEFNVPSNINGKL